MASSEAISRLSSASLFLSVFLKDVGNMDNNSVPGRHQARAFKAQYFSYFGIAKWGFGTIALQVQDVR
jgi:hypothetical protein